MIPILTIKNALEYLQRNTPPQFRNKSRVEAMELLSNIYKQFVDEHEADRPKISHPTELFRGIARPRAL